MRVAGQERSGPSVLVVGGGFGSSRSSSIIDDPDAAQIDWDDETDDEPLDLTR